MSKDNNKFFHTVTLSYDEAVILIKKELDKKPRQLHIFAIENNLHYTSLLRFKTDGIPYKTPELVAKYLAALGFTDIELKTNITYTFTSPK